MTLVAVAVSWLVMVVSTALAWYFDWGLYWAWGFASAYVMLTALIFLARFRQGNWKQLRIIDPTGKKTSTVQPAPDWPEPVSRANEQLTKRPA